MYWIILIFLQDVCSFIKKVNEYTQGGFGSLSDWRRGLCKIIFVGIYLYLINK